MLAATLGPVVPVGVTVGTAGLMWFGRDTAFRWRGLSLFLLFPGWAVLSTLWSPDPILTARYSVQLFVTFVAVLAMVASLPTRSFIRALLWAAVLTCVLSIASGIQGPSTQGPVLVGLTGSKNAMATVAYLLLLVGATALLDRGHAATARIVGALGLPLAIYLLATTQASGEIVVAIAAPFLMIVVVLIRALPQHAKIPLFVLCLVLLSPVAFYSDVILNKATEYTLNTLKKDPTLTGRTLIWGYAKDEFARSPILGTGYRYFWMSNSPNAIGALHEQNMTDAIGFNFHNAYYEMAADLGSVGLLLGVLTMLGSLALVAYRALFHEGFFWVGATVFIFTMIVRAFGENLFQAFSLYGPMIFAFGGYGLSELQGFHIGKLGRGGDS